MSKAGFVDARLGAKERHSMSSAGDDLWPHTGAILCGGAGRRMGQPKAGLVLPDGVTMVERVFAAMSAVCRQVVLVGAATDLPLSMRGVRHIEDRLPQLGPMGGVEALLASGLDSEYLIAPCDIFLVVPDVFRLLLQPAVRPPAGRSKQMAGGVHDAGLWCSVGDILAALSVHTRGLACR